MKLLSHSHSPSLSLLSIFTPIDFLPVWTSRSRRHLVSDKRSQYALSPWARAWLGTYLDSSDLVVLMQSSSDGADEVRVPLNKQRWSVCSFVGLFVSSSSLPRSRVPLDAD